MQYILNGPAFSFRIGFGYEEHGYRMSKENMLSAVQNPGPVEEYLQTGRIVDPFEEGEIPAAQVSRFGVIPKANQQTALTLVIQWNTQRCSIHSLMCFGGRNHSSD